ncbi:MAG TPA: hypothetical protein DET40_09165 [Lentisphaeria bacterium]|nr:MAG: hypothetical protein A2X45_07955 [Lentisphaerae bacterium GWF2_50_93]HCE43706.1 hypothetical protein [Lentisphaeria bacterium]
MKNISDYFKAVVRSKYAPWGILLLAAIVPYAASLKGDFVFDDIPLLAEDPFYKAYHPFTDCWKRDYWMESMAQGLYRPLTIFSYWVNAKVSGLYPPAFRAMNLFLHIIAVFVVFNLALRLRLGRYAALIAGVLFAIHPIHTEAVIPAFGRGEVLCGIFIFTGLLFHTYVSRNPLWSIGTAACFVLACWSKEHGVALVPLCILYDFYSGRMKMDKQSIMSVLKPYVLYTFALVVVVAVRYEAMGTVMPAMTRFDPSLDNPLALCPYPERLLSAISIQGFALYLFIWPVTLSHDYSFAQMLPLKTIYSLSGIAVALIVFAMPFILIRLYPKLKGKIVFFSLAYAVSILPAANIITPTGTIFAERLYYIPSVWLCFALATILMRISRKVDVNLLAALLVAALIALSFRTYARSLDWRDQLSISLAGVRTSPKSAKTWNNLAVQLVHEGRLKEAIAACGNAIHIYPRFKMAYLNRAFYNIKLGNFEPAEKDLRMIIDIGTENSDMYNKLGAVLANLGKSEEAARIWSISLKMDPAQPMIKRALEDLQEEIGIEKGKNDVK